MIVPSGKVSVSVQTLYSPSPKHSVFARDKADTTLTKESITIWMESFFIIAPYVYEIGIKHNIFWKIKMRS
ncbi:hypothetical protein HMPREF9095_1531 [Haemophilus aegyptius ATCC 11116]|nr:hypothetical protein HMPREF9095_1531 [Haemophilus aegyptius ATCC 11116]